MADSPMAGASKVVLFFLAFCVALVVTGGESGFEGSEDLLSLRSELEQLRSKVSALEASIAVGNQQLKAKDETLVQQENSIDEKSAVITSLQAEIESLEKEGAVDSKKLVGEVHSRATELELQIGKLKGGIKSQVWKRDALEARAVEAEKKVEELNLLLERVTKRMQRIKRHKRKVWSLSSRQQELQKTNDEQKMRIKKTNHALKDAEEELMKAQFEASLKNKELAEVHGAWLPHWLLVHTNHCQASLAFCWKNHGKPNYDIFLEKVSQISAQAQKKAECHLETAKTKWIPMLKELWVTIRTFIMPYTELVATKTIEIYNSVVITLKPHIVQIQGAVDPYFQDAWRLCKLYFDQVMTDLKPHVDKVHSASKPYSEPIVYAFGKFYHQVQVGIKAILKKHELTRALATEDFVWSIASAFLALGIFLAYSLLAAVFCNNNPRRSTRKVHSTRAPRKHKHRHADKQSSRVIRAQKRVG